MALGSKKSQGNNSMYVQAAESKSVTGVAIPVDDEEATSSGQSTMESSEQTDSSESDTSDSIAIGDNFYSTYGDPTLESALSSAGFSQLRPEILGSFEFISPLTSDSKNVSEDSGQVVYNSTGAGELLDMQNQLKQLRYAETMYFLRSKCGLLQGSAFNPPQSNSESVIPNTGIIQNSNTLYQTNEIGNSPTFRKGPPPRNFSAISATARQAKNTSKAKEENYQYWPLDSDSLRDLYPNAPKGATKISINTDPKLLMSFREEMKTASTVLDFFSSSLSIYDVESAINIKLNNYVSKNSPSSSTSAGRIASKMKLYDDDFVSNKAPGNISFESYIKDYLKIPESYWNSSSSTALMMQLVADIAGRTVFPQDDFSDTIPSYSDSFSPGEILGIDKSSYGGYEILKQLGKINLSELDTRNVLGVVGTNRLDSDDSGTDMFTRGDFFDLWDSIINQKDSKLLYVMSRDFINHCYTQRKLDSGDISTVENSAEKRLADFIGWDPFEKIENLASIPNVLAGSDSDKGLGVRSLRPLFTNESNQASNTGQGVSPFYVASFNRGKGDTPADGKPIKPGLEYFIGDFLAGGVAKNSIDKLILFSENLDNLTSKLTSFLENSLVRGGGTSIRDVSAAEFQTSVKKSGPKGDQTPFSSTDLVGIEGNSGQVTNSAALVQRIFEEFSETLHKIYLDDLEFTAGNNFGESSHILWFAAAANNPACAWEGLKYLLARDKLSRGDPNMGFNQLESISRSLLSQVIGFFNLSSTSQSRLTKHGFGYDGDAYSGEHSSEDDVDGNNQPGEPPGPDIGTDYDGPWFLLPSGDNLSATEMASKLGLSFGYGTSRASSLIPCLSDSIGRALDMWETETASAFSIESDREGSPSWKGIVTNDLNIGRDGRLVVCYLFALLIFQQTQKFAVWVPSETLSSSGMFSGYQWGNTKISLSKRSIAGLRDANNLKKQPTSEKWDLVRPKFSAFDDDKWNWETGSGYRDNIEECINLFWSYYRPQLEYDILAWNSLYFLTEISDRVSDTINKVASSFQGNSMLSALQVLQTAIKNSEDIPGLISASITKDQVRLSRYLQSTLSYQSRDYPYVPSSCVVTTNQAQCLGTLCKINHLVKTEKSGKKRIFTFGLPSGLVEFLRISAAEEMSNPRYNNSNVIKISLWRRDLLDERVCPTPQEFLFDVSRFIIDGRSDLSWSPPDASSQFFEGQTVKDLLENTVIAQFDRDGIVNHFKGQAYGDDVISEFNSQFNTLQNFVDVIGNANINDNSSNALKQIFNNHVLDHYLKLYLRLTSGIDVSEDVFCFLADQTFITGPERDKKTLGKTITDILTGMYNADDLASALTYQRVRRELERSIILSPQKYRNRIVYPKIFDRVFCIVADDADWIVTSPVEESPNTSISGFQQWEQMVEVEDMTQEIIGPEYYQYFITASIMTEIDPIEGQVKSLVTQ